MGWNSAVKKVINVSREAFVRPQIERASIDFSRLVTIDFETYYDADYTLRKLSTVCTSVTATLKRT